MANLIQNSKLTFKNEGHSDPKSPFFTGKAHWPKGPSGVTVGKGYDMKKRSKAEIKADLEHAGLDSKSAEKLAEGAGLVGKAASEFAKNKDIQDIVLTQDQEIVLFNKIYQEKKKVFERICQKKTVENKYGKCDLSKIDAPIKEFAIDLLYRGDYNGEIQKKIQTAIVTNNYDTLIDEAQNRSNWGNVDTHRFNKRIEHLKASKQLFNMSRGKPSDAPTSPAPDKKDNQKQGAQNRMRLT